MQVRLGFSIFTALNPDILIIDEVLAVGDADFRTKCKNTIKEKLDDMAVIFVSHNMHEVAEICSTSLLLDGGKMELLGAIDKCIERYQSFENTENIKKEGVVNGLHVTDLKHDRRANTQEISLKFINRKWDRLQWRVNVKDNSSRQIVEYRENTAHEVGEVQELTLTFEDLGFSFSRCHIVLYCVEEKKNEIVFRHEFPVQIKSRSNFSTQAPILKPLKAVYS
jgi:ABC-type multidrug transport system ATPase subunit